MKHAFTILTFFLAVPAWSLTKQGRIDYSAMRSWDEANANETAVVPVQNGYVLSRSKLQSYVEVKDDKWNATVEGKPIEATSRFSQLKSFFTDFMQLKHHADDARDKVSDEEMKKIRLRQDYARRLGQELRTTLSNFQHAEPLRVPILKTCSASLTSIDGTYLNKPFTISITSTKAEPLTQTTELSSQALKLQETEGFVQVGASRLAVYKSTRSQFTVSPRQPTVSSASRAVDGFNKRFAETFIKNQKLQVANASDVTNSLTMAWHLTKELGSCCADRVCREAIRSKAGANSSGGLSPYNGIN